MKKNYYRLPLIISTVAGLGVVSFALCVASEFKRTKRKDLKLDGQMCYLPGSSAFGFGIAALICLFGAQIIGNVIICRDFWLREKRIGCRAPKPAVAFTFLFLSWISFGISVILIGAATSMNRRQPYGEGWLDGECYVVKDGVYPGAAVLVLVALGSTLASIIVMNKKREVEQEEEWLDGECYVVKDGVYPGAAILVLVAFGSALTSIIVMNKKREVEQCRKIYT